MKLINYLKCAYTVIRPAGFSYCIALLIGALASYIGANSQSRITAMIQSVDSSAHILPLLGYSVIGGLCIASRGAIFTLKSGYISWQEMNRSSDLIHDLYGSPADWNLF